MTNPNKRCLFLIQWWNPHKDVRMLKHERRIQNYNSPMYGIHQSFTKMKWWMRKMDGSIKKMESSLWTIEQRVEWMEGSLKIKECLYLGIEPWWWGMEWSIIKCLGFMLDEGKFIILVWSYATNYDWSVKACFDLRSGRKRQKPYCAKCWVSAMRRN